MGSRIGNWRRGLRARLALAAAMALALVVYGLMAGGGKSVVPFAGKPVSFSDAGTPALVHAAAAAKAADPVGFSVSEVVDANNNIDIAALGANHSLDAYWEIGAKWYGPLTVNGAGTTFSAPKLIVDGNGNLDLAVQGPGNSLWVYWNIGGVWHGPLGVGGSGTAFSTPTATSEGTGGTLDVSVQGPGHSLYMFWEISGTWYGPISVPGSAGNTFSKPSMDSTTESCGSGCSNHFVEINAQGPFNDLRNYEAENGTWSRPQISGPSEDYSATTTFSDGPYYLSWFEGQNNAIDFVFSLYQGGTNEYCVAAPPGEDFSAPDLAGNLTLAYVGPSNSLLIRWYEGPPPGQPSELCIFGSNSNGPLGVSGTGTTFSTPSIVVDNNSNNDIAFEGPGNTLWVFFDIGGTWHGPIGVGAPGSTFSSPN